jgi:hypothetical protein
MKKTTCPLVLLCAIPLLLAFTCEPGVNKTASSEQASTGDTLVDPSGKAYVRKDAMEIYLAPVRTPEATKDKRVRLALFDANGDYAVDTLRTKLLQNTKFVLWRTVRNSEIRTITEIKYVGSQEKAVLFKKGARKISNNEWILFLPDSLPGLPIEEKYSITFTLENSTTPYTIDPYLRVLPTNP